MRILYIALVIGIMAAGFCNDACAANLDDIYKPLLQKNRFLLESEASYYRMNEIGNHGSATYGEFKSTPDYMDLQNTLSFSITDSLNIKAGFGALLPAEYTRTTYNAAGGNDIQRYKVQHMYDFSAGARARLGQVDFFSEVLARRQRSTWDYAPYPNPTCFFTMIKSHSEDVRAGLRFITEDEPLFIESNLSKIKRPLLREKQVNLETNVTYRSGEALRGSEFFFAGVTRYNYFHDIKAHYEPELIVRYGIRDNLEAETGISYQTPLIYHLNADRFNPAGTTVFTDGIYKVEHKARIPCAVRYRADDKIEIAFSSPVEMAHQRLDYWQKQAGGVTTMYPEKKLFYFNTKPAITLTYLHDAAKEVRTGELESLTKTLLRKNQFIAEFQYQRDISVLDKDAGCGSQNIIDPYNIFLYPLDLFVVGTEYAVFFIGNTSQYAANVRPQNYNIFELAFRYGLTDTINVGLKGGYRTESAVHHFTVPVLASRFYQIDDIFYFDAGCDWRLSENTLFTFTSHFVPNYRTKLDESGFPEQFNSKTRYFLLTMGLKVLF